MAATLFLQTLQAYCIWGIAVSPREFSEYGMILPILSGQILFLSAAGLISLRLWPGLSWKGTIRQIALATWTTLITLHGLVFVAGLVVSLMPIPAGETRRPG